MDRLGHRDVAPVGLDAGCPPRRRRRRRDLARAVNEAGRRAVVDHPGRFGLLGLAPAARCRRRDRRDRALHRRPRRRRVRPAHQRRRHLPRRRGVGTRCSASSTGAARASSSTRRRRSCWEHTSFGRPRPMLEFLFDTTRAVVEPRAQRHGRAPPEPAPDRPARRRHAPGASPTASPRSRSHAGCRPVGRRAARPRPASTSTSPGTPIPRQLDALLALTTLEHLHYGSDFPFTPDFVVEMAGERLDARRRPARLADRRAAGEHRTALSPARRRTADRPERTSRCTTRSSSATSSSSFRSPTSLDAGAGRRRRPRSRRAGGDARTWRDDDRGQRLVVQPGPANDAVARRLRGRRRAPRSTRPVERLRAIGADIAEGDRRRPRAATGRRASSARPRPWGVDDRARARARRRGDAVLVTAGAGRLPHRGRRVRPRRVRDDGLRRVGPLPHRRPRARAVRLARDRARARDRPRGPVLPLQRAAPHRGAGACTVRAARSACTT